MNYEEPRVTTARSRFLNARHAAKSKSCVDSASVCILRDVVFDELHAEILTSVADFVPLRLVPLVRIMDLNRTPFFFYLDVLCVRAMEDGAPLYTFA